MSDSMMETVARAICGNSLSGYCAMVGGHRGCKVGRGESFNGHNCIAPKGALMLGVEWGQARAFLEALLVPTDDMVLAGACGARWGDNIDEEAAKETLRDAWVPMIVAALADDA